MMGCGIAMQKQQDAVRWQMVQERWTRWLAKRGPMITISIVQADLQTL